MGIQDYVKSVYTGVRDELRGFRDFVYSLLAGDYSGGKGPDYAVAFAGIGNYNFRNEDPYSSAAEEQMSFMKRPDKSRLKPTWNGKPPENNGKRKPKGTPHGRHKESKK